MRKREKGRLKEARRRARIPEWSRGRTPYRHWYQRGLTPEQVKALVDKHDGHCAGCGEAETAADNRTGEAKRLAIDHCHSTGKVRGMLCHRCNIILGGCKDNPDLLRKLAFYIESADTGFRVYHDGMNADHLLEELGIKK